MNTYSSLKHNHKTLFFLFPSIIFLQTSNKKSKQMDGVVIYYNFLAPFAHYVVQYYRIISLFYFRLYHLIIWYSLLNRWYETREEFGHPDEKEVQLYESTSEYRLLKNKHIPEIRQVDCISLILAPFD